MNDNKVLEEHVRRRVDTLRKMDGVHAPELNLAEAKIIEAFMWLNRAVFRPARMELLEDGAGSDRSQTQDVEADRTPFSRMLPRDIAGPV